MKSLLCLCLFLFLICSSAQADLETIERLASDVAEAQALIETRVYLKGLNEKRKKGTRIDDKEAMVVAKKMEDFGEDGCECVSLAHEDILRSQAYALSAGIYGILSKVKEDPMLGLKSYKGLIKSRELMPNNTDAIKGQATALNMILKKGWSKRKLASIALGIDLRDAQIELIKDLRDFPERKDLQNLADQLEKKL